MVVSTGQEQSEPVVLEVPEAVASAAGVLDEQVHGSAGPLLAPPVVWNASS